MGMGLTNKYIYAIRDTNEANPRVLSLVRNDIS